MYDQKWVLYFHLESVQIYDSIGMLKDLWDHFARNTNPVHQIRNLMDLKTQNNIKNIWVCIRYDDGFNGINM